MILKTDTSSLGNGGGDLQISELHPEFRKFVEPMVGLWYGKTIDFVGDYTESSEYAGFKEDEDNDYKDITKDVFKALVAIESDAWFDPNENYTSNQLRLNIPPMDEPSAFNYNSSYVEFALSVLKKIFPRYLAEESGTQGSSSAGPKEKPEEPKEPKKRGRPPKSQEKSEKPTEPKKRGRPPKSKEKKSEEPKRDQPPKSKPKKRGRPPKSVSSDEKPAKRPRGRPPKVGPTSPTY